MHPFTWRLYFNGFNVRTHGSFQFRKVDNMHTKIPVLNRAGNGKIIYDKIFYRYLSNGTDDRYQLKNMLATAT